jgi:phage repressor protein C with HTH and peptisase S24 domain
MTLKHNDIWRAIDRLAERHGLSPSGLAKKAGLSPTVFNNSKRVSAARKRWPSTESIAHILRATDTELDAFVALASPTGEALRGTLPMIGLEAARENSVFDDDGRPTGKGWEEIGFPAITDPHTFAFEITGKSGEPVYREGDRIIVSPAEKPRRGDRVVARTKKGVIIIGQLGRESARMIEIIPFTPAAPAVTLAPNEIEWINRIVWASQ